MTYDIPTIESKEHDVEDCRQPKGPHGGVHHAVVLWISQPLEMNHPSQLLK